jgi:hypothetical protein
MIEGPISRLSRAAPSGRLRRPRACGGSRSYPSRKRVGSSICRWWVFARATSVFDRLACCSPRALAAGSVPAVRGQAQLRPEAQRRPPRRQTPDEVTAPIAQSDMTSRHLLRSLTSSTLVRHRLVRGRVSERPTATLFAGGLGNTESTFRIPSTVGRSQAHARFDRAAIGGLL